MGGRWTTCTAPEQLFPAATMTISPLRRHHTDTKPHIKKNKNKNEKLAVSEIICKKRKSIFLFFSPVKFHCQNQMIMTKSRSISSPRSC